MNRKLIGVVLAAAMGLVSPLMAQGLKSLRSKSIRAPTTGLPSRFAGDRLRVANTLFGVLIMRACDVDEAQLPKNVPYFSEKWDIDARSDHAVSRAEMMLMLQTLLAECFKLRLHSATKDVAGYGLVVAKGGPSVEGTRGTTPRGNAERI